PTAALHVLDKALLSHPDSISVAEDRVLLKCVQGDLAQADLDNLEARVRTAGFEQGAWETMETLRTLASQGTCPALPPKAWLQLPTVFLANRSSASTGVSAGFLHYQRHHWAVSQGALGMAIHELDLTYPLDPDANIPRLQAKYLVSAQLYDQAIAVLRDTDYSRLPLLRRLLVDDRAINASDIAEIEKMRQNARGDSKQAK